MIGTLSRIFWGFLLACLTAGIVQVLFILTPGRIIALPAEIFPDRIGQALVLALLAATHAAIFSAAFVLIATILSEFMRIRSIGYYLAAGAIIAMAGFAAQYSSEVAGQPTILNNYAIKAFLTSGFFAGLVYWLAAGRKAGGRRAVDQARPVKPEHPEPGPAALAESVPRRRWRDRPRMVLSDASLPGTKAGRAAQRDTLSDRLAKQEAKAEAEMKAVEAARAAASRPVTKAVLAAAAAEREAERERDSKAVTINGGAAADDEAADKSETGKRDEAESRSEASGNSGTRSAHKRS